MTTKKVKTVQGNYLLLPLGKLDIQLGKYELQHWWKERLLVQKLIDIIFITPKKRCYGGCIAAFYYFPTSPKRQYHTP